MYDFDETTQISVTNSGSIIIIDKENDILFYNDINMYLATKNNLGYDPTLKQFKNAKDMDWSFWESGLLAYSKEEVYFWGVNVVKERANKVK